MRGSDRPSSIVVKENPTGEKQVNSTPLGQPGASSLNAGKSRPTGGQDRQEAPARDRIQLSTNRNRVRDARDREDLRLEQETVKARANQHVDKLKFSAGIKAIENALRAAEQRVQSMSLAPTWEGIAVVEKALDALQPALADMHLTCMKYVNSLNDVTAMVNAAKTG